MAPLLALSLVKHIKLGSRENVYQSTFLWDNMRYFETNNKQLIYISTYLQGLEVIDQLLSPPQKKLGFVCIWFSFAFALFLLNRWPEFVNTFWDIFWHEPFVSAGSIKEKHSTPLWILAGGKQWCFCLLDSSVESSAPLRAAEWTSAPSPFSLFCSGKRAQLLCIRLIFYDSL